MLDYQRVRFDGRTPGPKIRGVQQPQPEEKPQMQGIGAQGESSEPKGEQKHAGLAYEVQWFAQILYMGVSKNRGTLKWMVYNGKPY